MSNWTRITDETLPPIDTPVFLREGTGMWIGGRVDHEGGWLWGMEFAAPFWNGKRWEFSLSFEIGDHTPTHFQLLPEPDLTKDLTMQETQASISQWANETFGEAGSNARVAARANEEMAELLRALTVDDNHPKSPEELADIVIVLSRLATRLGVDMQDEVDRKMEINRKREWKLDNTGHGYHVREKA